MKKHDITDNELDLIFNHMVEQSPLLGEDRVFSLLESHQKPATARTSKNFFSNSLNSILITFAVLGIVTIAYWGVLKNTPAPVAETIVQQQDTISTPNVVPSAQPLVPKVDSTETKSKAISTITNPNSEASQSAPELSLIEMLTQLEKKPQIFSVKSNRDTVLQCKEGTTLRIKANSFVSEKTGQEISGNVQLKVKEYYKLSDILLARLSTTSDGKIIETGGMLHLLATSGTDTCTIKQGEKIEIGFPFETKKSDMIAFTGIRESDKINWEPVPVVEQPTLMISDGRPEEDVFMVVEEMPEYPGGNSILMRNIKENIQYPYSALKNKQQGKVFVNFVVDRLGYIRDIRVAKGLGNVLDKAAAYVISQIPGTWKPGKQRGLPVDVSYTISVDFRISDADTTKNALVGAKLFEKQLNELKYDEKTKRLLTEPKKYMEDFEKKVKDGNVQESDIFAANQYVLGAYQLGWINCDRYVNFPGPKTSFSVLLDDPDRVLVNVIFNRFKSIIPGAPENDCIRFKGVPIGEKITVVALKTQGDKVLLSVQEAEITENAEINLNFRSITPELLKSEMEKIGK